jgi:hypothetical protein
MRNLLIVVFVFFTTFIYGQVVINEISSAQNTGYADEDGDYPDWIELYNAGTSPVNLEGYKLVRQEGSKVEWTFPVLFIQPGEHLTVFASEKNRKLVFDHWEVPVYPEMIWKYFEGSSQPPSNWNLPTFNDVAWNSGQGGIGYGDGDDSTIISNPITSCFLRTSFTLTDTSNIAVALLAVDYDDSFVAYLNGVELKRNNIGVAGVPPLYNDLAYVEHEAQEYQGGNLEFYFVDDAVLNSAKVNGLNTFAVQVNNFSGDMSDMTIRPYFLLGIRDTSVTFFPFPVENNNLHTNFNISSSPFRIKLYDKNGVKLDEVIMDEVHTNHSRGRKTDGNAEWCVFETPTPDTNNVLSQCFKGYASEPIFTLKAGFYNGNQTTQITAADAGTIRFTNDGSIPIGTSTSYVSSLVIDSNTILKAKLFPSDPNLISSRTASATYFLNENIKLPVISITTNPENLWSHTTGIYVMGPYADSINYPFLGANFWMGWEKEAHIEYFDRNKEKGFGLDIGLKIHGNYSKSFPQKSFRVLAKDDYNEKWINYSLFPEKPYIKKFKNFNIRNAGIDYNTVHFRDAFMLRVVRDLKMDYMAYEPCVLFLNGQYWGVYGMRERQDDRYIYNNHSEVREGTIDYLRFSGDIIEGTNKGFLSMANFMVTNDLSIDSNYNKIANDSLDIKNFTDYYVTETYYGNVDWLSDSTSNNIKFWRVNEPVGKWKYVLWDTDLGTGLFGSLANASYDYLGTLMNAPAPINPHVLILQSLLDNTRFKHYFINRYADLINTTFQPDRVNAIAQAMEDDLEPEMARHFNKWAGPIELFPTFWVATSVDVPTWKAEIDSMLFFMQQRPAYVRGFLETDFGLTKQVDVTLKVEPEGAGVIKINTIIPDKLPWTGVYFDGVPVTISAIPNSGYTFNNWESNFTNLGNNKDISFKSNVASNDVFTAHFNTLDYGVNIFPNPANNEVNVSYEIPEQQQLSIKILSSDGKIVAELVPHSSFHQEGQFTLTFTKQQYNLAAGTYFIEFKSEAYSETIKFTIF